MRESASEPIEKLIAGRGRFRAGVNGGAPTGFTIELFSTALAKFYPEDEEEEEEEMVVVVVDEKNVGKRRIRRRWNTVLRRASADGAKGYCNINRSEFLQRRGGQKREANTQTIRFTRGSVLPLALSYPIFFSSR